VNGRLRAGSRSVIPPILHRLRRAAYRNVGSIMRSRARGDAIRARERGTQVAIAALSQYRLHQRIRRVICSLIF
jgi:hypothetical protein